MTWAALFQTHSLHDLASPQSEDHEALWPWTENPEIMNPNKSFLFLFISEILSQWWYKTDYKIRYLFFNWTIVGRYIRFLRQFCGKLTLEKFPNYCKKYVEQNQKGRRGISNSKCLFNFKTERVPHCVSQASLRLRTISLPTKNWAFRCEPPCPARPLKS